MLFHIQSTHSYKSCGANDPEKKNHRHLFGKSYTVEMKKSSEWMEGMGLNGNVNLTHIRIDTRNSDN